MPIKESNSSLVEEEANALRAQNPNQHNQEVNSNGKSIPDKLDPQKLFDLVSKNYDTWLQVMSKQFKDEENFLPFPKDESTDKDSQPIFNYTLLEALEKASSDFSEKVNDMNIEDGKKDIPSKEQQVKEKMPQATGGAGGTNVEKTSSNSCESLLKESEINFLRNKITQMIASNNFSINNYKTPKREGFSLYDTQDEEGLHDGNTDQFYDDEQDDYDLEEVQDDFLYDYLGQRRIEVELNTAPECETHGFEVCDCPIFHAGREGEYRNGSYGFDEDEDGPSCEFTFEYDNKGKLVPTYSNVEEKLRLMNLESRISTNGNRNNLQLPSINEIHAGGSQNADNSSSKSKKKNKKKKRSNSNANSKQSKPTSDSHSNPNVHSNPVFGSCCLFCEYEVIYGSKPRQMIKWYDQRVQKEEQRRLEIKTKLENAKLRALKKQRELRQKQLQQNSLEHPPSHTKTETNTISSNPKDETQLDNLEAHNDQN